MRGRAEMSERGVAVEDEEVFARAPFDIDVESEEEADAALVGWLHLALRRSFERREGCWPGRDVHDTLRRTCHAAEVLHSLPLDADTRSMVADAAAWLINLRLPPGLDAYDRLRTRLYPSRFKTLAYLGAFDDPVVREDFAELLGRETGGMIRGVTESDMLTTCIVLDTLITLEQSGIRVQVCADRTFEAIRNAVRRHFASWRPDSEPHRPIPLDTGATRAHRNSGPLCEIDDARSLSYAWGLLHQAGRGRVPQRQFAAAYHFLEQALARTGSGRSGEIVQVFYSALQLAEHRTPGERAGQALRPLIAEVRQLYRKGEATRHWALGHHALVVRLLVAYHGQTAIAQGIAAAFLRQTERRRQVEEDALRRELKEVIRERVQVEVERVDPLSGGYTEAQVYRVPFRYWYPMSRDTTRAVKPENAPSGSVIVKRSTRDAFLTATENYRQLPERLRGYFARQPDEGQVYKSGDSSTYYLAMEDLADFLPLGAHLEEFDRRHLSNEHLRLLDAAASAICDVSFNLYHETVSTRASAPGTQIARLYLAPVEAKLLRAVQSVPWLKSALQDFTVGGQRYRELDHYLGIVARHAQSLQPRTLGMVHGDFHAGNILLDAGCRRVKLIDLDKLTRTGDYVADLGNLLADVCVYRRVAHPEADYGLAASAIQFVSERGEVGTAENTVRYPALGRPATVAFQRRILEETAAFAARDDVRDASWRPRLWLATSAALLVRLAFEARKDRAAVLYGEAIGLLSDLCKHLETGAALGAVLISDAREAPAAPSPEDVPEWARRYAVLRTLHHRLRQLPLNATADRGTITYSARGDSGRPLAKLVPPGREGIGRLLLPADMPLDGAQPAVRIVRSGQQNDALGTIVILEPATDAGAVAALAQTYLTAARLCG